MPRYLLMKDAAIDVRVAAFAALMTLGCVVTVTLVSARAAWRSGIKSSLADGGGSSQRKRLWVLSAQIAIGLVLTVGGALVAGSLLRVWSEDPGLHVEQSAVMSVWTAAGAPPAELEAVLADLRRVPGVVQVGGIDRPLIERAFNGSSFDTPPGVVETTIVESIGVTYGYLEAAGLTLQSGRLPTETELTLGSPVVVLSDIVARQYWPGETAVGRFLTKEGEAFSVIGVVSDVRYVALDLEPQGAVYWPLPSGTPLHSVLVRFDRPADAALPTVLSWISRRCAACFVGRAQTLSDALARTIRPRQFNAWLFSSFSVAALAIVGTGILGLVAMVTSRRTREIGIRMALGSTPMAVVGTIVREQIAAVGAGLVFGALIAAWAVRFVSAYMYKIETSDPRVWAVAVATILGVALVASVVPAVRAGRVDPVLALRMD
jgi:hypothetical protein